MTESETIMEKKQARGFAGLIGAIMEDLNDNPRFKEAFKDTERSFLINATNLTYAALIKINKGHISVESIPNKPKENLTKSKVGWDGRATLNSQDFLLLASNRLPIPKLLLKILTGRIKLRGITKLIGLLKIISILQG